MKQIQALSTFILSILLMIFLLTECSKENSQDESVEKEHEDEGHNEIVQLSKDELNEFSIELAQAGPGKIQKQITVPGEIIIPPDNLAHIHPRFPGIVKMVYKHIGDRVKKGQILATIEGNESLSEYEVKSLIKGTIIEKHISVGEVVEDADHGFIVADLSQVWGMLKLYQKDLAQIKVGQHVIISSGRDMPQTKAIINYISPIIDEATRTATARVVLQNPDGRWKPGLFINGTIFSSIKSLKLVVPRSALLKFEEQTIVFIQEDDGFHPSPVSLGEMNDQYAEIISGLEPDQIYVAKGGFTLKSELQKASFGGHVH